MHVKNLRASIPPSDLFSTTAAYLKRSPALYAGLGSEEKARRAVKFALTTHATTFSDVYAVHRIVGIGANGVGVHHEFAAPRIGEAYKHLAGCDYSKHLLQLLDDWQDSHHIYLVTELYGFNWAARGSLRQQLQPLTITFTRQNDTVHTRTLDFYAGSSDLWAYRDHLTSTCGECTVPLFQIKEIIKQTALGLQYAHNHGYYHGDVKAENILLAQSSRPGVKIADLGNCKHISTGLYQYGTVEATPPELLFDSPFSASELDGRDADVFALGLVLYTLLQETGKPPEIMARIQDHSVGYKTLMLSNGGLFPLGDMSKFDRDAVHLLKGMTEVEPAMRMSVAQVLAHRFLL
ncbi:kinase-like domain-containing protein [Chytriomyces cf. hyalinus JEL632]|nr:kinase-like domain-containing protein [Chytriomyces cf. hyalinus JEL632]